MSKILCNNYANFASNKDFNVMKKSKKAILDILSVESKGKDKGNRFESLVLNLALQKIDSDDFEFDGEAVYTVGKERLIYCLSHNTRFVVPSTVKVIGEQAFRHKTLLKEVTIPESVTTIEKDAFCDCDALDNVVVPKSVKRIGEYAFSDCDEMKTITFKGVPDKMYRNMLSDCDDLHRILIPAGSFKIFAKLFHYDGDREYILLETKDGKAVIADDDTSSVTASVGDASADTAKEAKAEKNKDGNKDGVKAEKGKKKEDKAKEKKGKVDKSGEKNAGKNADKADYKDSEKKNRPKTLTADTVESSSAHATPVTPEPAAPVAGQSAPGAQRTAEKVNK